MGGKRGVKFLTWCARAVLDFLFCKGKQQEEHLLKCGLSERMKEPQTVFRDLAQERSQETPIGWAGGRKLKTERRRTIKQCDSERRAEAVLVLCKHEVIMGHRFQRVNPDLTAEEADEMIHKTGWYSESCWGSGFPLLHKMYKSWQGSGVPLGHKMCTAQWYREERWQRRDLSSNYL